jgi:hypothetical protein
MSVHYLTVLDNDFTHEEFYKKNSLHLIIWHSRVHNKNSNMVAVGGLGRNYCEILHLHFPFAFTAVQISADATPLQLTSIYEASVDQNKKIRNIKNTKLCIF